MKLNNIFIVLVFAVSVLIGVLFFVRKSRIKEEKNIGGAGSLPPGGTYQNTGGGSGAGGGGNTGLGNSPLPLTGGGSPFTFNKAYPLKIGSNGAEVALLQAMLGGTITGTFTANDQVKLKLKTNKGEVTSRDELKYLVLARQAPPSMNGNFWAMLDFPTKLVQGVATATANQFPLKSGKKGYYSQVLQLLVYASPDGAFGPKTEAALYAITGKKTVDNAAELIKLFDVQTA